MIVTFEILGEAVAKGRPIVTRNGTFTPTKTRNFEDYLKWFYQKEGLPKLDGAILMMVIFHKVPPVSTPKKTRLAMLLKKIFPTKKPDIDNLSKSISDGLNRVAYDDDKQIFCMLLGKVYAETEKTEIILVSADDKEGIASVFTMFYHTIFEGTRIKIC